MPAGRPSLYSQSYCSLVIEEMAEGKSLTAFAAEIGVSRDTISEWCAAHEEFSVAVKIGKAKCAAWWEDRARGLARAGGQPGQATSVIFGLKNMAPDDWADRTETKVSGDSNAPLRSEVTVKLDDDTLDRISARLLGD